jgi:hypothetical protein
LFPIWTVFASMLFEFISIPQTVSVDRAVSRDPTP